MIETGGGEAETGCDKKSAPVFARDMAMRPRKLLHMNLVAAKCNFIFFSFFKVFGRMKKKAKTAGLKSSVQPRLLPHSNPHHPELSVSLPSVSRAPSPSLSPVVTPHPCTDPCLWFFELYYYYYYYYFGFLLVCFFPAARAQDLGDEGCGRSMALKSAFLGCESIDGRDSSHSCAISMSTSSAKVFFLSLSPSLGCSRPFFPPCSAFQAESTLSFCFQSSVLSLLHVFCLSVSQIQWGRTRGFRVYGPETLNLKTLKTKRDRDEVSKFVFVGLAYQGKDVV
jgi:hypothetical protein